MAKTSGLDEQVVLNPFPEVGEQQAERRWRKRENKIGIRTKQRDLQERFLNPSNRATKGNEEDDDDEGRVLFS
jgi:hypothetical protein